MFTKSKVSLAIIAVVFIYVIFSLSDWKRANMLQYDESGYYIYLPAAFIYHDIGKLGFDSEVTVKYNLTNGTQWYGIYQEKSTGKRLNKYFVGTSILELPFFLIAHLYCCQSNPWPADGYSMPYLMSVVVAGVFWVLAGLFFLRKFLLGYFGESATSVTLLLLALGTNLYFYTVLEKGMSHPFSFALFCFLLFVTEKWYRTERKIYATLIGLVLGMIIITRPTNAVAVMIPLLWSYKDGGLRHRFAFYLRQKWGILSALLVSFLVLMIQCGYWKYVTGNWLHFSYEAEYFNFSSPEILNGLFSYSKGWFLYTPVAFIALFGLIPLAKNHKTLAAITVIFLSITVYIVFSWCVWFYGGCFGCRALIEDLAVVSIPLVSLIQWLFSKNKVLINVLVLAVFAFVIWLNLFQSYQVLYAQIPWDGINKEFYWRSFGKFNTTPEDWKLLYK